MIRDVCCDTRQAHASLRLSRHDRFNKRTRGAKAKLLKLHMHLIHLLCVLEVKGKNTLLRWKDIWGSLFLQRER
jgi:hypothetical protein